MKNHQDRLRKSMAGMWQHGNPARRNSYRPSSFFKEDVGEADGDLPPLEGSCTTLRHSRANIPFSPDAQGRIGSFKR
ncbi:MAG: hypothetical protein FWC42_03110 [Proteobacteria bacterium]|nr:hypothetical protein [Pseudomonadota bacterium]